MATKKAGGSTRNGRDSAGKRLGVKRFAGQEVESWNDYRPPTGNEVSPGNERRHGPRSHDLFVGLGQSRIRNGKTRREWPSAFIRRSC